MARATSVYSVKQLSMETQNAKMMENKKYIIEAKCCFGVKGNFLAKVSKCEMTNQFSWQCTHLHSIDTFFSVLQILEQQHVVGHVFSSAMAIASARHSETVISYFAPAAADIIRRHQMCGFFHVCDVFFNQLLFTPNDRTTQEKESEFNSKNMFGFFAKKSQMN